MDTTDVDAKFMHTVTIHDREYQKYVTENDIHFLPIDEEAIEHLEAQNELFDLVFDRQLIFPPVDTVQRVLDLGYGTASWAIQVADKYPDAKVIGIDISCHMLPDDLPDNFKAQIGDLNKPLAFPMNHFNLVQARGIGGGINKNRWSTLSKDIARILKPGGWTQLIEFYHMFQSDNGSITETHALRRWSERYMRSISALKNPRAAMALQTELTNAGLVNVESRMIPIPLCAWHADEKEKKIGNMMAGLLEEHVRSLSLLLFTKMTFMGVDEFQGLVREVVGEAGDATVKAYLPLYVCIGQKPL